MATFLVSLYLTLRISYRKVISHLHSKLPSVESVKGAVREFRAEDRHFEKEVKVDKKLKAEYETKRKEIERELEEIRKERDRERKGLDSKAHTPQLTINSATKHIPILKKEPKGLLSGLF
jgi:predicted RNase H-like nuclease (RuvC/YqgF family)